MADRKLKMGVCNACGRTVEVDPKNGRVLPHGLRRGGDRACAGGGFLPRFDEDGNARDPEPELEEKQAETSKAVDFRRRGRR